MDNRLGKERAKRWAELATTKGRREHQRILLDARSLVEEGIRRGIVHDIAIEAGTNEDLAALFLARTNRLPLIADAGILRKIADVESSPGIVAVAEPPAAATPETFGRPNFFAVYLDRIADPGNLGTIARSAAAFGAAALLISPGTADPSSPKALRASAGALLRLPILRLEWDRPEAHWLRDAVLYRAVVKAGTDVRKIDWSPRRVLWLGNEAHGVGAAPAGRTVIDVTIPMSAGTESLNVAAAAVVLAFAQAGR